MHIMQKDVLYGNTLRKSYSRVGELVEMPNLIEVQKNSYRWFLEEGLREVFKEVSVIADHSGNLELSFTDYRMDEEPKYSITESKERDATYAAPLKVKVRLRNLETEEIKEQELFLGDLPLMTDNGTFIINGAERVIISQIVRSPGIYFSDKTDPKTDKKTFSATIIPNRGAWLEYETDNSDLFYVRIDKNRKLFVTSLIRTLGYETDAEIKNLFGENPLIVSSLDKDPAKTRNQALIEIYKRVRNGEYPTIESAETLMNNLFYDPRRYDLSKVGRYKYNKKLAIASRIVGRTLAEPVADPSTGEILAEAGDKISREKADEIEAAGVSRLLLDVEGTEVVVFSNGMVRMDRFVSFDPAEIGIHEMVRYNKLMELLDAHTNPEDLKEAC